MKRSDRTLIVDDDDLIAVGLQQYLELRGCEADTARDYDRARTLAGATCYAVVLVDVVLTGHGEESGVAFLRWLRNASPQTVVVVLTAFRTPWLEAFARTAGVAHVYDKPAPFEEIVNLVSALAKGSASLPEESI
jgi:DNA-binding response OmpR family regulator